jgi:phosphoglycolate phosphatase
MLLALFDVDGTLISTRGAGMRAFYRALNSVFGVQASDGAIRPDGKTDPLILRELLAHFGLEKEWCDAVRDRVFSCYLSCLEEEMSQARARGMIRILPGVKELLDRLEQELDFCVGLVTGNLERGAHIKVQNAGLEGYFRFGGYGSDSENRTELTRAGIQRGARHIAPAPLEGAFVIGDTPLDIHHGRAAGACTIAVASAKYGMDELASHSPDLLVPDLTAASDIIGFMRSRSQSSHRDTAIV